MSLNQRSLFAAKILTVASFCSLAVGLVASSSQADSNTVSDASTGATSSVSAAAATSSASFNQAVKDAQPRKFFLELYSESVVQKADLDNGVGGNPSFINSVGVKYDLGDAKAIYVRQFFDYNSPSGANGQSLFHVEPTQLQYLDAKLMTFGKDGTVTGIARVYLPTDETSRNAKNMGSARGYLIASKPVGKVDLSYIVMAQYYNQTQNTYVDPTNGLTANRWYRFNQEADAFYNFTSKFSAGVMTGTDSIRYRPIVADNPNWTEKFYIEPALQYAPVKGAFIQFYVDQHWNLWNPSTQFALGRDTDMFWDLNVVLTL